MRSEIIDKFFGYLAVGEDHKFFNHFFRVNTFFQANVNGRIMLIQLKHYLVFIKYLSIIALLSTVKSNSFQNQQPLFEFPICLGCNIFLFLQFTFINLWVNNVLGLFIGQLGCTLHHCFLKSWRVYFAININGKEGAKCKSAFFCFESKLFNKFGRHHMYGLMRKIGGSPLIGNFPPVDQMLIRSNIGNMYSKLINTISQFLNGKSILHIYWICRINGKHHLIKLTMIFYWQIIVISWKMFRI